MFEIEFKPLGISDCNMCLLTPVHRQLLKTSMPAEKLIYRYSWSKDANDTIFRCVEATDFDVLCDSRACIDDNVDLLNSYQHFCISNDCYDIQTNYLY